ncbi:hypothetical protein [Stygiolobus caldivivus]|uniref:Dihydroorotate dehydrogenase electron transfer subunit iron-sulphur cluster binding domain-containing protein n=1 Tax=Stygiolobus caldivivus TaxID=2824673 RepID=A0A8D5UA01_9CREN|nr:hypothetical protein [Stygiolobus caldivivus]BCU71379.1 hypothetical protein KN1_26760 [Stygiolobus caldivivus]
MPFGELTYSQLVSVHFDHAYGVNNVILKYPYKPGLGQYISLVFPSETEIPLTVGDYEEDTRNLSLYIESERIISKLTGKKYVLVKGPLGRPITITNIKTVLGVIKNKFNFLDLRYILKELRKRGITVRVACLDGCNIEGFENVRKLDDNYDLIIASVPESEITSLPKKALVYVRWVKMNCNLGVCGECNYKGLLPCIEGPFVEVKELVD